jgi:hypothetical protein
MERVEEIELESPYPYTSFDEWHRDARLVREVRRRGVNVDEPTEDYTAKVQLLQGFGYRMLRTGAGGNFRPIEMCPDLQVGTAFHHVYRQVCKRLDQDAAALDEILYGIKPRGLELVETVPANAQLVLFG